MSGQLKRALRRSMIRLGLVGPLVERMARNVRSMGPEDAERTLLALKPERFRGDLDILAGQYGFRILSLEKNLQQWLIELSWGRDFTPDDSYYHPAPGSDEERKQQGARAVLRRVLPPLLERLGVDCVLTASTYYLDDWDYAHVLGEMNFPNVVIYRECFQASQKDIDLQVDLGKKLGRFPGSHILVHNETTRQTMLDSGLTTPDKVSAPGCMRMDPYIRRLADQPPRNRERKLVSLFSFVPCAVLPHLCTSFGPNHDLGFQKLFDLVHQRFARLAGDNPDVDFLIKPKWGGEWIEEIDFTLAQRDLDRAAIPNLRIDPGLNAQDVILDSDVVVGWGSTVLCEAGIAAKPVIIPHFAEATSEEYGPYVLLTDYFDGFDIAASPDELEQLVLKRLEHPEIADAAMARRREAFERYVSPLTADASEQSVAVIRRVIEESKRA